MMPPVRDPNGVTHRRIDIGEVSLHVAEAGGGPLVVLVHGFPDGWYTWRGQIRPLADLGRTVAAPDLRGYGTSDRPRGVDAYAVERLVADVDGLLRAYGAERAALVAHDWGGGIAWAYAMAHPERVERIAILNSPHPVAFTRALRRPRQLVRSWYMFYFQLPWLPERALARSDFAALRAIYRDDPTDPRSFTPDEVERHVAALRPPGAMTAAVNYYRALFRGARRAMRTWRVVEAPVLVLWGERDRYLGPDLAAPDPRWAPNARVVRIPGASHWVHLDASERVNAELARFLAEPTSL